MKHLLSTALLLLSLGSLCAEANYHRPPGMPENTLVVFDDFKAISDDTTFEKLLGIHSFRWMLQIPKDARTVLIILSKVDTETQQSEEIARFAFDPVLGDPAKRENRPTFFPVRLTLLPEDTKTDAPWRVSRSFLALFEVSDLDLTLRRSYPNPFRSHTEGLSIFRTTRIATPLERKPGMWDGLGTAFDMMASGNGDRFILRASFRTSAYLAAQ